MAGILVLGTCDSKLYELLELRRYVIEAGGYNVMLMDIGRRPTEHPDITFRQPEVLSFGDADKGNAIAEVSRNEMIRHMAQCASNFVKELVDTHQISAIIAAGGSCGTSLAAPVMRALPFGFPKLIVSTMASGNTGPIVGESDVTLMYSVVDISGSNSLLRNIFANAAGAIVGMAAAYIRQAHAQAQAHSQDANETRVMKKRQIGMTMFGVTTACCDAARRVLESSYDCEVFVFHATGHGGQAMERLIKEKRLDAVLDITTTEVADYLMDGVLSAGPARLEAAAGCGIPCVVSLGATDMVNFGARNTVPARHANRNLFEHNPAVTLMRTSAAECKQIGEFIADKLKTHAVNPQLLQVVIPAGGVSAIAAPGGPFADAQADKALFDAVENGLHNTGIVVATDTRDINSMGEDLAGRLASLMNQQRT